MVAFELLGLAFTGLTNVDSANFLSVVWREKGAKPEQSWCNRYRQYIAPVDSSWCIWWQAGENRQFDEIKREKREMATPIRVMVDQLHEIGVIWGNGKASNIAIDD